MNAKIRDAQLQKIPYMCVVGDKELDKNSVSLRLRSGKDEGPIAISDLIAHMQTVSQSMSDL
jgi:threonyl-tRNA synthetase